MKDEMINIIGDNEELWLAHVQAVHNHTKSYNVYFYIASTSNSNVFQRKCGGRLEKVHWDSIVSVASGRWINTYQFFKKDV